ncbi:MAG: hypothetical protein H6508_08240 [Calditrichaeota bacterium]|nr:hypothetical protein [Calditrichota bacterium]
MKTTKRGRPRTSVRIRSNNYPLDYHRAKSEFLQTYVSKVLDLFKGNVSATARALGMSRRSVQLQMKSQAHPQR